VFDSPSTPKRPRVFFTEEQKEALRTTYKQDPYPNQATIESLANDLGVGVKTVVNWFHNHRMRAKQQTHGTSGGASSDGGSSDHNTGSGFKSEPLDECSNHSDMSSVSGDVSLAAAAMRQVEAQWLFPQFEQVGMLQRKCSEDWDQDSLDDRMDETDGGPPSVGGGQGGSIKSPTDAVSLPPPPPVASVNKRKRSNPQRVFEGVQLERAKKAAAAQAAAAKASVVSVLSEETGDENQSTVNEDNSQEPSTSATTTTTPPPSSSPFREGSKQEEDEEGEDGEGGGLRSEREERISKLEQGLGQSEGWGEEEGEEEDQSSQPPHSLTADKTETSEDKEEQSAASKNDQWEF
jgi:hypothetical protein